MASALSYRRLVESLLATTATATMFYFGNGLDPLWPLMWFAPLPVLLFALRSKWWVAAVTAVAAMMLGNLNMWSYFTKTLGMPGSAWVAIFLIASVAFAAGTLLFRVLVFRGALWSGLLALPAVWVTSEYVRNVTSPHGSAGSLAYSQLKFLPFLQLASITGPWGMSFVLLLFPAAIAIGVHVRQISPKRALQVVGLGVGVVAAVLLFGAVRLAKPQTQVVKVGLIASDEKANDTVTDPGPDTERLFRDFQTTLSKLPRSSTQRSHAPHLPGQSR